MTHSLTECWVKFLHRDHYRAATNIEIGEQKTSEFF